MQTLLQKSLNHVRTEHGIAILIDLSTGASSFAEEDAPDSGFIVTCPDGHNAFSKIDIYPFAVICQLPKAVTGDIDLFRIYFPDGKGTGVWLENPEAETKGYATIPPVAGDPVPINFFGIITADQQYLYLYCVDYDKSRVYATASRHWIEIPRNEGGPFSPIISFKKVEAKNFQDRPALILESDSKINPLSVYFLDRGEYLLIGSYPGSKNNEEKKSAIFYAVFPTYAVVGMIRGGLSIRPDWFHIWRFKEGDWLAKPAEKENSDDPLDRCRFFVDLFTEAHIGVFYRGGRRVASDHYQVLSTQTWEPVSQKFVYSKTTDQFDGVEIGTDGTVSLKLGFPIGGISEKLP